MKSLPIQYLQDCFEVDGLASYMYISWNLEVFLRCFIKIAGELLSDLLMNCFIMPYQKIVVVNFE